RDGRSPPPGRDEPVQRARVDVRLVDEQHERRGGAARGRGEARAQRAREARRPARVRGDPDAGRVPSQQRPEPQCLGAEHDHDVLVRERRAARGVEREEQQRPGPAAHELLRAAEPARAAGREQHARDPRSAPCYRRHHVPTILNGVSNIRLGLARYDEAASIASMSRHLIENGLPWSWDERRIVHCMRNRECVVLAVSDTRDEKTDKSGALLVERLRAAGHRLAEKAIVRDDVYAIRAIVSHWIADEKVEVVITTGGTGLTGRDGTPEAVRPLLDKTIEGFGELFRTISYEEIGPSSLQS